MVTVFSEEHSNRAYPGIDVTSLAKVIWGWLLQQLYRSSVALVQIKGTPAGLLDGGEVGLS
jgi:hypothetical protein